MLEENTITINNKCLPSDKNYLPKAKEGDIKEGDSRQKIKKAGLYLLQGFKDNGARIKIASQDGTNYEVSSNILKYAEPISQDE